MGLGTVHFPKICDNSFTHFNSILLEGSEIFRRRAWSLYVGAQSTDTGGVMGFYFRLGESHCKAGYSCMRRRGFVSSSLSQGLIGTCFAAHALRGQKSIHVAGLVVPQ